MVQRRIKYQMHLIGAGFIILLAACDGESAVTPVVPGPEVPQETAYLSLSVNIGDALTTRSYDGTFEGTPEERFVQGVRLVLYNGNSTNSTVVKSIDYDIKTAGSGSNAWTGTGLAPTTNQGRTDQFITYAEVVPKMDYYALAIINPTAEMKNFTATGKTLAEFDNSREIEQGGKTMNVGGLAEEKQFVMTNAQGLVQVLESTYLKNTINAAHNKPVPILVERIVAKVTLTTKDGSSKIPCTTNCQADHLSWGLDITNKWTYWMRKTTGNVNDPVEKWYAEDPNYTQIGEKQETDRMKEFFYYKSQGKNPATLPYALKESEYCLENTMDDTDQTYDNVATRVLFKCTYKPFKINTLGEGYYVIDSDIYTHTEMELLYKVAKEQELTNTKSELSKKILNAETQGYKLNTGGIPEYNGSAVAESFESSDIRYYHNGVNYYAIKIRHFGENDSKPLAYGHYGVLRNTHYTVKLESIIGPGAINLDDTEISTRAANTAGSELYENIQATIIVNSYDK